MGLNGDDIIVGTADDEKLNGGAGDDTLTGGAGDDTVSGNSGDDVLIYIVEDNIGSVDVYDGGSGYDTIQLEMTKASWLDPTLQAEIAAYLAFISDNTLPNGSANNDEFTFASLGLTVSKFETINIFVDGQQLTAEDDPVVAVDDVGDTEATEDDATPVTGNVLTNDSVPDLVASLSVTSGPSYGTVVLNDDGGYSYVLDSSNQAVQDLNTGETLTDTFEYTVVDANGDSDTATVSITINGVDDGGGGLILDFGNNYAAGSSETVVGSAFDDTITFGVFAGWSGGNLSVDGLGGNDTITFGNLTGATFGNVSVDGGDGNDVISFGPAAAFIGGNVTVNGGAGADEISFGSAAGDAFGSVTIDLGAGDGAADTLILAGDVFNTSIQNWVQGEDNLVDVVDPSAWTGVDNGTDTVFTAPGITGVQSITFAGVTGLVVDASDFFT